MWWKWFLSIPRENSPAIDATGKGATINQSNPNVWFLAGTVGGPAERLVRIQSGKAVLFPVINISASKAENPALKTESDLWLFVKKNMDDITKKTACIDGEDILISEDFRVLTPIFDFYYPLDNIFEAHHGLAKVLGDGYWIFMKPPSTGEHTIRTSGACLSGKIKIDTNLKLIVEE